jgi:hypothetical protein
MDNFKKKEAPMHIHRKIERFLKAHDYPATKFGRMVAGDPRLVRDMRSGRQIRPMMAARADAFMTAYVDQQLAAELVS